MIIFEKEYDGESLYDLGRDIEESTQSDYNPIINNVPQDQYGFHKGIFRVSIVWYPKPTD